MRRLPLTAPKCRCCFGMELNQRWQLFEAERNLSGIRIAMAGRPLLNLFGGKKITIILKKK